MTVKQLINKLSKYDNETEVKIYLYDLIDECDKDNYHPVDITDVHDSFIGVAIEAARDE